MNANHDLKDSFKIHVIKWRPESKIDSICEHKLPKSHGYLASFLGSLSAKSGSHSALNITRLSKYTKIYCLPFRIEFVRAMLTISTTTTSCKTSLMFVSCCTFLVVDFYLKLSLLISHSCTINAPFSHPTTSPYQPLDNPIPVQRSQTYRINSKLLKSSERVLSFDVTWEFGP